MGQTGARTAKIGSNDLLSIVEAAYAVEGGVRTWNSRLVHAVDQALRASRPSFAGLCELDGEGRFRIDTDSIAVFGDRRGQFRLILEGLKSAPPNWVADMWRSPEGGVRCALTSELDPDHCLHYRGELEASGIHDGVNVIARDLDNRGWLLSLGVGAGYRLTPGIRRNLVRVGTHILAAKRLRERLSAESPAASPSEGPARVEAVLSSEGVVLHAEGQAKVSPALRHLREAVRRVEEARTAARSDSARALGMWQGLVAGRWSLLDEFERNGARYVIARRNPPCTKNINALSEAERSVVAYAERGLRTKEIAYALGISDATVRVLLMRAVRKCGVRDRIELLRVYAGAPSPRT